MSKKILTFLILIFLTGFSLFIFFSFKNPEKIKVLANPDGCWGAGGVCNASCQYGTMIGVSCYPDSGCALNPCMSDGNGYNFSDACNSSGTGSCYIIGDILFNNCYSSCSLGALCWEGCWGGGTHPCEDFIGQASCKGCEAQGCSWEWDNTFIRCAGPAECTGLDEEECETNFLCFAQRRGWHCIGVTGTLDCTLATTESACESCFDPWGGKLCWWWRHYLPVLSNPIGTVYAVGTQCTWYTEPLVSTLPESNVTQSQATLNGEVTNTGNTTITERGFDWKKEGEATWTSWTETGSWGTGTFNYPITGLEPYTTYYFRAKAKNSAIYWGVGGEVSFQTLDQTPPTVTVTGNPANWQNTDALADLTCSDTYSGCDATTYRLKIYSTDPGTCSTNYSDYDIAILPYAISSHSWVCGAAKDNSGNTGFSSPVEFKVDKLAPTSTILSPGAFPDPGNWQNPPSFLVSVTDLDTGGSGLASCAYGVWDNVLGIWTVPSSTVRACSASFSVTVGPGADCRTEGQETCRIYVYSIDGAGNGGGSWRDFSISWTGPTTEILCNGQPCTDEPYLNSVEISLVCTPGSSTCEATFDCSDQTNTCDPNPCNP
jgi:hypothetical protein